MKKHYLLKTLYISFLLFLITPLELFSQTSESSQGDCFLIMAGNKTTRSNSVLLGHNNDLNGNEFSFLKKHSRQKHDSSEFITFQNGLKIPQINITPEWMALQTKKGIKEGDAVAINEYQVAIAGGVSLQNDRNDRAKKYDPLIDTGVTGGIRYVALQRASTARECVKLIGEFYNKYGISYPSGIGIADKNEIWYMEAGGGHHWAAIKIPDNACWIQANGYRIEHIDTGSNAVMTSPGLLEFAKENGLWNPEEELFSFKKVFGGATLESEKNPYYNTRRVWRAIELIAPSMLAEPNQKNFPLFIRPDSKLDIQDIMRVLKDHYQNTDYNPYKNDNDSIKERPIASKNTVHTSIIQLRNGLPSSMGAILWAGLSSPVATPYVPVYFGIHQVPFPYSGDAPDENKAFNSFKRIADLYYTDPSYFSSEYPDLFVNFQQKCIQEQRLIDQNAFRLFRSSRKMALHMLTVSVESLCQEATELSEKYYSEMQKSKITETQ